MGGWVPEHTALFLWDQLALEGARPNTFRELLPVLCFCLLEVLREALLSGPRDGGMSMAERLMKSGRTLQSDRTVAIIKQCFAAN